MPKRKYKEYLEPCGSSHIPRRTLKRISIETSASSYHDELDSSMHEPDVLPSEHDVLISEQDMLPSVQDMLPSVQDMLPSEHDVLTSEHDMLPSVQDMLTSEYDLLSSEHNMLPSDNDLLPSDDDVLPSEDDVSSLEDDVSSLDGFAPPTEEEDPYPPNDPNCTDFEMDLDSPLIATGATTKAEALIMILSHAARHKITGSQLGDLLKLINCLFGQDVVPRSKYTFNKVFQNGKGSIEFHCYCKNCKSYCGTEKEIQENCITRCSGCNSAIKSSTLNDGCFFINVPIATQIQCILENAELQSKLNYRADRPNKAEGIIADIYDGEIYKGLSAPGKILSNINNLSFTFNSDGSPLYKSSKVSIWPIQLHLNELPPNIRFKHVILAGLWFGPKEPEMHMFLKPFVEQAKSLALQGVTWRRDGRVENSKVVGICCCVDSKARPAMQNSTQFNGYYGCSFCFHPGTLVERQVKYTVTAAQYPDRDSNGMIHDMEQALIQNKSVRGVKGPSPLITMPYFDIAWGFTPDYMHAVLLGVARQHTALLLESSGEPYYIGSPNTLRILNDRIQDIKPPHLITRLPRRISECKYWKASEWRAWLLFYSLPCLEGLIDVQYTKHVGLLTSALYLLLQEEITYEEVNLADEMLLEFVVRFQRLFGEAAMTFNVHLLSHLAKAVKYWGPLWAHSAFVFEGASGNLLKLVHGTKDVPTQITVSFMLHKSIPYLLAKLNISDHVLQFCSQMNEHSQVKNYRRTQYAVVLDSGRVRTVSQAHEAVFLAAGKVPPNKILVHNRMIYNGLVFTSHEYSRAKRRNDWCVRLSDGCGGEIHQIISFDSEGASEIAVFFIPFHIVTRAFALPQRHRFVPHITCVGRGEETQMQLVNPDRFNRKCVIVESAGKIFLCDFPNTYERD